jgi:hypothetical protein
MTAMDRRAASDQPSDSDREIFDGVLTLAQFSAFLLPGGTVAAGAIAVFQMIFDRTIWGRHGLPLSTVVSRAIAAEVQRDTLEKGYARMLVVYEWFKETYETAWGDDNKIDLTELAKFENQLSDALGPNSDFLVFIQQMQSERYGDIGFSAFMFGAALRLALMKVDATLSSSNRGIEKIPEWRHLQDVLKAYIAYATTTKARLDGEITARLEKVLPVDGTSFTDTGTGDDPKEPVSLKFGPYPDTVQANVNRDAYIEELTAKLNMAKFRSQRPDKIDAAIEEWEKGVVNVGPLVPG